MSIFRQGITNLLGKNAPIKSNRFYFTAQYRGQFAHPWFSIENIEIPEYGINTEEQQLFNMPIKLFPYSKNYGDQTFTVTFRESVLADGRSLIYDNYTDWANIAVANPNTNIYWPGYYDNITGTGSFKLLNELDKIIIEIEFAKIYPLSVKLSQLDMNDTNTLLKTTVKFYFEDIIIK